MIKISALLSIILAAVSCFQIKLHTGLQHLLSAAQRGNISDQELATIKRTIDVAESEFDSTEFNKIAKNISLALTTALNVTRWNAFVYDQGIKELAISPSPLSQKKYISILNYGRYNLSYEVFGVNPAYSCSMYGGGGSAEFGESVNSTKQQKIRAILNNSIIYRGSEIESAAQYITGKANQGSIFGNPFTMIANPTTQFGYYVCRNSEDWASLRNYGELKWNYYFYNI